MLYSFYNLLNDLCKFLLYVDRTEEDNFGGFLTKVVKSQVDSEVSHVFKEFYILY